MSLPQLTVLYGHLEGTGGKFARDPSGYLSIEAGIFRHHGLEVSWQHVQGTEERYRRLENGAAEISLVAAALSVFRNNAHSWLRDEQLFVLSDGWPGD
jgi:hypothetical protein